MLMADVSYLLRLHVACQIIHEQDQTVHAHAFFSDQGLYFGLINLTILINNLNSDQPAHV